MTLAQGPIFDRRDIEFQLFDVLGIDRFLSHSRFSLHDRETVLATLDLSERIAAEDFLPAYRPSDLNPPTFVDGRVVTTPGVGTALRRFSDAGFMAAALPVDEGGMDLPWTVAQACYGMFQAANIGASVYYFLTVAAANVLRQFAGPGLQAHYLPPMLEGRYFATMCLSEPQAGSSLADVRTRATPMGDGSFRITGTKMWISAGDHDLGDNIVHLVLARLDGARSGTRGLSLLLVPKRRVKPDGSVGEDNNVETVGLNHKMGYRAATNAVLAFGARGDTIGHLVGEAGQGLRAMFVMMNEARISVGCGAAMLGGAGYLQSLAYARDRVQGRLAGNEDPHGAPVKLIEHADVRRMLLVQKAYVEGALSFCLYVGSLVDEATIAPDELRLVRARRLLEILTPVAKAWPSEFCLEANKLAMQVLGGYGYTIDFPVEQYYRDNRLNLIHEGTNGIQAIDLVGRRLFADGGALWSTLLDAMRDDMEAAGQLEQLTVHARRFRGVLEDLEDTTAQLGVALAADRRRGLANASLYADALGHVCIAWMWLRQARVAVLKLDAGAEGAAASFYHGKIAACRFFFETELGRAGSWLAIVRAPSDNILDVETSWL